MSRKNKTVTSMMTKEQIKKIMKIDMNKTIIHDYDYDKDCMKWTEQHGRIIHDFKDADQIPTIPRFLR